MIKTYKNQY